MNLLSDENAVMVSMVSLPISCCWSLLKRRGFSQKGGQLLCFTEYFLRVLSDVCLMPVSQENRGYYVDIHVLKILV